MQLGVFFSDLSSYEDVALTSQLTSLEESLAAEKKKNSLAQASHTLGPCHWGSFIFSTPRYTDPACLKDVSMNSFFYCFSGATISEVIPRTVGLMFLATWVFLSSFIFPLS